MELLVAGQEVQEQRRIHDRPALALAEREHLAEQFLGLAPVEEVLLIGGALIGIAGRDRDAAPRSRAKSRNLAMSSAL